MCSIRTQSALAWAFAAAGLAVAVPVRAQLAHYHVQHAAACKPANLVVKGLQITSLGVTNVLSHSLTIVCPIDRLYDLQSGSFIVYVYGKLNAGGTVSCTLASYSSTGDFLGSSGWNDSSSPYQFEMALPASQIPPQSVQSVTCSLPTGGSLFGYSPDE
jgi:hypothetical protein